LKTSSNSANKKIDNQIVMIPKRTLLDNKNSSEHYSSKSREKENKDNHFETEKSMNKNTGYKKIIDSNKIYKFSRCGNKEDNIRKENKKQKENWKNIKNARKNFQERFEEKLEEQKHKIYNDGNEGILQEIENKYEFLMSKQNKKKKKSDHELLQEKLKEIYKIDDDYLNKLKKLQQLKEPEISLRTYQQNLVF